ncbi:MAG TPA: hypothetical protein VGC99_00990 [Candidatus Tectomicrobia bacterium]
MVGPGMEYKVRTTIETQRVWRYRCDVFRRDKAMKWAFSPIVVDRTSQIQHIGTAPESNEALRLNLAEEAVAVHFTRCGVLREYLTLASIYSQPPPAYRRRYTRSVLLVGVALLTAYGVWSQTLRTRSGQAPVGSPAIAQQAPHLGAAQTPVQAPDPVPLPTASSMTNAEMTDRPSAAPDVTPPAQAPKRVLLSDLLAPGSFAEHAVAGAPASTAETAVGETASAVQEGDMLLFTGWVHWISRASNSTYQLYVTPSPKSRAPGLLTAVPAPDQPTGSPAVERQLQMVRSFITQRLLRQPKPSPRRSVMQKPIFVQLMGRLSSPDASHGEPAGGKRVEGPTAGWEVRPVLDIQFANPPTPSSRSRSR